MEDLPGMERTEADVTPTRRFKKNDSSTTCHQALDRIVQTLSYGKDRFVKGTGLPVPIKAVPKTHTALPQAGVKPAGRNDQIAFFRTSSTAK